MTYSEQADQTMRDAIASGIFNPSLNRVQHWQDNNSSLLRPLMESVTRQWEQNNVPSPWLHQQSSWQLPTTRRYVQSRMAPNSPLIQPDAALAWLIEVCRYPVVYGSVGIIKSFEQYVAQGEDIWTSTTQWGNPYPTPFTIRWFFRLSPLSRVASPWLNATGTSAITNYLPGDEYSDLSESRGIWFPASSSSSSNIHLTVPGNRVLRVLALVGPSQSSVSIAAKLAGTTQSETNQDAQFVVRTTW